jgi:hypothetical protein
VKCCNDRTVVVWVNRETSILELKQAVWDKLELIFTQPEELRLLYGTFAVLEDCHNIQDYNIRAGATLTMLFRLRGGAPEEHNIGSDLEASSVTQGCH